MTHQWLGQHLLMKNPMKRFICWVFLVLHVDCDKEGTEIYFSIQIGVMVLVFFVNICFFFKRFSYLYITIIITGSFRKNRYNHHLLLMIFHGRIKSLKHWNYWVKVLMWVKWILVKCCLLQYKISETVLITLLLNFLLVLKKVTLFSLLRHWEFLTPFIISK